MIYDLRCFGLQDGYVVYEHTLPGLGGGTVMLAMPLTVGSGLPVVSAENSLRGWLSPIFLKQSIRIIYSHRIELTGLAGDARCWHDLLP